MCHHYWINESNVWCIRKSESNIHASVAASFPQSAEVSFQSRDPHIERMKRALNVWIEDQTQEKSAFGWTRDMGDIIADLPTFPQSPSSIMTTHKFHASMGLFEKFKRRFGLHHEKLIGEAVSADQDAAKKRPTAACGTNLDEGIYAGAGF